MKWVFMIAFLSVLPNVTLAAVHLSCFKRESLRKYLIEEYAEKPISAGIVDNGFLMEVFSSVKTDLWVIIMTSPDETSCIMATGSQWRSRKPESLGEKL